MKHYIQPTIKTVNFSFEGCFICCSQEPDAPGLYKSTSNQEDFTNKKQGDYDSRLWADLD